MFEQFKHKAMMQSKIFSTLSPPLSLLRNLRLTTCLTKSCSKDVYFTK